MKLKKVEKDLKEINKNINTYRYKILVDRLDYGRNI